MSEEIKTMNDMPVRPSGPDNIWAQFLPYDTGEISVDAYDHEFDGGTKYVRADLATPAQTVGNSNLITAVKKDNHDREYLHLSFGDGTGVALGNSPLVDWHYVCGKLNAALRAPDMEKLAKVRDALHFYILKCDFHGDRVLHKPALSDADVKRFRDCISLLDSMGVK